MREPTAAPATMDAVHYFPFGEVWLEEVPQAFPTDCFLTTAKELDEDTGLYYFGARYLDPRFSKWMTADPALGDYMPGTGMPVDYQSPALANRWRGSPDLPGMGGAFQPGNLALYGYGHQNPATLVDPDGKCVEDLCIGEAILLTGLAISAWDAYKAYRAEGVRGAATSVATDVAINVATGGAGKLLGKAAKFGYEAYQEARAVRQVERAAAEAKQITAEAEQVTADAERGVASEVPCSFAEKTPVTTSEGLKPIGELKTGDRVLARSEETGACAFEPITQVFRHQDSVKVHLTLEAPATGATEVIERLRSIRFMCRDAASWQRDS